MTQATQDQRETEEDLALTILAPEESRVRKVRRGFLDQRVEEVTLDPKALLDQKAPKVNLLNLARQVSLDPEDLVVNQALRVDLDLLVILA